MKMLPQVLSLLLVTGAFMQFINGDVLKFSPKISDQEKLPNSELFESSSEESKSNSEDDSNSEALDSDESIDVDGPSTSTAAGVHWALIVAGSNGYDNYRHQV